MKTRISLKVWKIIVRPYKSYNIYNKIKCQRTAAITWFNDLVTKHLHINSYYIEMKNQSIVKMFSTEMVSNMYHGSISLVSWNHTTPASAMTHCLWPRFSANVAFYHFPQLVKNHALLNLFYMNLLQKAINAQHASHFINLSNLVKNLIKHQHAC